jgi:hypothetical protein
VIARFIAKDGELGYRPERAKLGARIFIAEIDEDRLEGNVAFVQAISALWQKDESGW